MNAGGPVDDYLNAVRGAMRGMDPRVREDILRELRSHVAEAASANGGDVPRAVAALGPASQVGRAHRAVSGAGRGYQILFIVVAALLSALTVPVLGGAPPSAGTVAYAPNLASFPFLVLVVLWLLWVSVAAGSRAGLYAGLGAFAGRIAMAAAIAARPRERPGARSRSGWWRRRSTLEMVPTQSSRATAAASRWADTPTPMPPCTSGRTSRAPIRK